MSDSNIPGRNVLVVPMWLYAQIKNIVPDAYCEDDRAYLIDSHGRVRPLKVLPRLVDTNPPPFSGGDDAA